MPLAADIGPSVHCSLRVLLVEDNTDDANLTERLLRESYPTMRCVTVQTREDFARQLRGAYHDVILADYALGSWTGVDAFNLMRKCERDIPFILVTGTLDDARAIECVHNGITDYVLKNRPERLPVVISRALEEKELLAEHGGAGRALKVGEE